MWRKRLKYMDNTTNLNIIKKIVNGKITIFKTISILPPAKVKDLWEEKNLIVQNQNLTKNEEFANVNSIIETKSNSTLNDSTDTTNRKIGIYKIVNIVNGHYYVGRSVNLNKRWRVHRNSLRRNIHHNNHLQNAWNKYGESSFEFRIIELLDDLNTSIEIEQRYIDKAFEDKKSNINDCYNLSDVAFGGASHPGNQFRKGIPHTIEGRQKISRGLLGNTNTKGKRISASHREKIITGSPKGKDNSAYNHTVYKFHNKYTNEYFEGNLYDLCKREGVTVNSAFHRVINGKRSHYRGWEFIPPLNT